ncbi:hypothetical protein IPF86_01665 [Candidatus Nomurabacteria bacterium]|jgi:hypothetical protein|nr:MAG: hypothetical protein IPF86_01665 [Candidatus Nomurabacteria bacterium]
MDPLLPDQKIPEEPKPATPETKPLFAKNIEPLRTYQSDMAEALREQQGSVIKIAIAEQKKKEDTAKLISPVAKKNIAFLVGSIACLVIAGGIFGYLYFFHDSDPIVVEKKPTIETLIFADAHQSVDTGSLLTKKQLVDAIREKLILPQDAGKITAILLTAPTYPGARMLTTEEFLKKLESDADPTLIRSFDEEYMFGTHMEIVNVPFLIFKTNSYDTAFSGMLTWERKLFDNMYELFGLSIEGDNAALFQKKFEDIIVENRDGRVLRDGAGNIVMVYVFLDTETILVTTSIDTIKEILVRLQTPL